jgi:cytochrome bd ubiquinol oxidase subunit I
LGYALLVKRHQPDVSKATDADIAQAALDTVPTVAPLFYTFRIMVAVGFYLIAFFAVAFWLASRGRLDKHPRFLKVALWSLPLP